MDEIGYTLTTLFGSKIPIDNYYHGLPCMLGDIVGKIIGESEEGSWNETNGIKMYSIPLFATPHGTIIKTGVAHLSKITDEGLEKLIKYERELLDEGKELYGNHFK